MVVPVTTGGAFAPRIGFAVSITGIRTSGVVRWDQPCVLDFNARTGTKVDLLPSPILDEAAAKNVTLFVSVASAAETRSTGP